ncbi:MAG: transcriptional regulator [Ktedonobacteraceae bacterium]
MNSTNRPNDALRYQRLLRGWSLHRVADEICSIGIRQNGKKPGVNGDMVGEWERGVKQPSPYYREKLCLLYSTTADQLDLIAPALRQAASLIRHHESSLVRGSLVDDMDKKRRELLRLLGVAGAALILAVSIDWERIEDALERSSHLDHVVVQNLEEINTHYWSIYLAASSKSSVLNGVLGQIKTVVQFLRDPHTTPVHQRLCMLVSDLSQLAGEIYFDRREYETAQSCYVFAATAAKEARAYDLWSCALVRHSFTAIYDEPARYEDALPLLQGARRLALRGDSSLPTRYWVAAVEAEAESGVHNLPACQDALERANGVLEIKQTSPAWTRFEDSRLPALRGACFVRLEQPDLAEPALQEALRQFAKPGRRRGMVLMDLATAALQHYEVERACTHVNEVIDIVALGSSGFLREGMRKLRHELEPYVGSVAVNGLDQHMRLLA